MATASQSSTVLIRTKLTRPTPRPGFVERPRLLERLEEALDHRVVLVSAPPGFGKTTLAAQWLQRRRDPTAWLSLDPTDGDPERFVRYLVAALEGASAQRLPETAALLDAHESPPFDYLCEVLVSELARVDGPPLVVTLDDYHAVGASEVHRLVERLVPALPPCLHLVALTRRDPPWPLADWRARDWIFDLRARDLRFSLEETRRFFEAGRPVPLSAATVEGLQERVEGWIAGLRLLKLSLADLERPEERAREFSGKNRLVADYLVDEVLAVQPPEIREFLAATAPLARFSAPLCDHLLAKPQRQRQPPARETLSRLEHANVFLVRLDPEGEWYRYHHLFQDLLLGRLPEIAEEAQRAQIHRRAAEWFAREGLVEEALGHWIAAGDVDTAADHLGEQLNAVMDADPSRQTLSRLLELFPAGAERERLPLLVGHAYCRSARWDVPGQIELVAAAGRLTTGRHADEGPSALLGTYLEVIRAITLYWQGDPEGTVRVGTGVLKRLPVGECGVPHSLATIYTALGLALTGRGDEGLRLLERAVSRGTSDRRRIGEFLAAQAIVHTYAGELDAVDLVTRRVLALHEATPVPGAWLGWVHLLRALLAYERNVLEESEAELRRILALRYRVTTRVYHDALIGLGFVALARRDDGALARQLAEARAYALEVGDPMSVRITDSLEARVRWAAGEPRTSLGPPREPDSMSIFFEVPTLTSADILLADSAAGPDALSFIEAALERAEGHHNVRQCVALSLLRAEALAQRGERAAALEAVEAAVRRAEPLGLIRTFVDRGPRLRSLLETLVRRDGRGRYLGTLWSAGEDAGAPSPPPGGPAEAPSGLGKDISNRERDVLELLAERLSNKEIADRLNVSPETVKMHTRNLYQKLEVHGRRQAVEKAAAEGVLRPRPRG